jgi:hypothetical protein
MRHSAEAFMFFSEKNRLSASANRDFLDFLADFRRRIDRGR